MRTTYLLRTSADSIDGTWLTVVAEPGSGGFSHPSTEYFTSAAVTSLPLWKRTPRLSVKSIVLGSTTFQLSASAGRWLSFASHSMRDSYIGSLPQWLEVRIAPNGAMCTGSCSRANVILPPFFGVAPTRFVAADAAPATDPAATAPAPMTPAFTSRSRRFSPLLPPLSSTVVVSDTSIPPSVRSSEDLTDPRCLSLDVVVEDGFPDLVVCEALHRRAVELDAQPRDARHGEQAVRHVERCDEHVLLLQRIVRVACEGERRRRGGEMRIC